MSMLNAADLIAGSDLYYVSDYFSFVGANAQGRVAFAIDNNRGRDGERYPAEHLYAVLHDERQGWAPIAGVGRYENPSRDALPIPNSPAFQFSGQPTSGVTITSAVNRLTLSVDRIVERIPLHTATLIFSLGSAPARLTWGERVIPGRVIYEYLVTTGFNLMTRRTFKGISEFQGLYLLAGADADLYIQSTPHASTEGPAPFAPFPPTLGFMVADGVTTQLDQPRYATTRHALAPGLYRWPTAWRVTWQGAQGPAVADLTMSARKQVGNWILVGFSMGIATGTLTYNGQRTPLYGLAEILMADGLTRRRA